MLNMENRLPPYLADAPTIERQRTKNNIDVDGFMHAERRAQHAAICNLCRGLRHVLENPVT